MRHAVSWTGHGAPRGDRTRRDTSEFTSCASCSPARRAPSSGSAPGGSVAASSVSYPDERFASVYARLLTSLRGGGRPIVTIDLLIATAAIVDDAVIVTRNTRHL